MRKREGLLIPSGSCCASGILLSAASGSQQHRGNLDNLSPALDCWMFSQLERQ